jgi:hypothetical protein
MNEWEEDESILNARHHNQHGNRYSWRNGGAAGRLHLLFLL